ncbi:chemotaxis protein CheB [Sulfitobacter sp. HNIBRBA3233]|uniref:chemotaxis protein CheB n=1 Tax=Sulfitobacter marinivivus TaxID=3158558 RepID=UPI0032DE7411
MRQDNAHPVIAIGGSAGGIGAMQELLAAIRAPLAAPVIIAVHSVAQSKLTEVLQQGSSLTIRRIEDGTVPEPGVIHIVPGGRHAYFRSGKLRLSEDVTDSGFRPSIDMLFMTLAAEYQSRAIAVILSGMLQDGMRGAQVIYDLGGRTVVQNPDDAVYESMPAAVIRADHPRAVLTATELGQWLVDEVGFLED